MKLSPDKFCVTAAVNKSFKNRTYKVAVLHSSIYADFNNWVAKIKANRPIQPAAMLYLFSAQLSQRRPKTFVRHGHCPLCVSHWSALEPVTSHWHAALTRRLVVMSTFIRHIGRNTRNTQKTVHKYTKTKYTKKPNRKTINQSVA